jgi:hypothetical protein
MRKLPKYLLGAALVLSPPLVVGQTSSEYVDSGAADSQSQVFYATDAQTTVASCGAPSTTDYSTAASPVRSQCNGCGYNTSNYNYGSDYNTSTTYYAAPAGSTPAPAGQCGNCNSNASNYNTSNTNASGANCYQTACGQANGQTTSQAAGAMASQSSNCNNNGNSAYNSNYNNTGSNCYQPACGQNPAAAYVPPPAMESSPSYNYNPYDATGNYSMSSNYNQSTCGQNNQRTCGQNPPVSYQPPPAAVSSPTYNCNPNYTPSSYNNGLNCYQSTYGRTPGTVAWSPAGPVSRQDNSRYNTETYSSENYTPEGFSYRDNNGPNGTCGSAASQNNCAPTGQVAYKTEPANPPTQMSSNRHANAKATGSANRAMPKTSNGWLGVLLGGSFLSGTGLMLRRFSHRTA